MTPGDGHAEVLIEHRLDAQSRRIDHVEETVSATAAKTETEVQALSVEVAKVVVQLEVMIESFRGARNAAYGVIGSVVLAAVLVLLGLRT